MSNPFDQLRLDGISVLLGMPAGRDIPALTAVSMLRTQAACIAAGLQFDVWIVSQSSVVQWARDDVLDAFLRHSNATRLFWVDSDMVWNPEQFLRLLKLSAAHDVVCAAYPARGVEPPLFCVDWDATQEVPRNEYGLLEVRGAGLGFTVMSRKVVEEVAARAPRVIDAIENRELASVFRIDRTPAGKRLSEDIAFFSDIRALGYKVWLDPQIDLGHWGAKLYTGSIRDQLR